MEASSSARASNYIGDYEETLRTVTALEDSLNKGENSKVKEAADILFERGNHQRTLAVLLQQNGNPLLIADRLITVLNSTGLQMLPELKHRIGRVARLFVDLTLLKARSEDLAIHEDTKNDLVEKARHIRKALAETEVGLRHEMKCVLANLKLLKSTEYSSTNFFKALAPLILSGDITSGVQEVFKLARKLNLSSPWIGQVYYIYMLGNQWTTNTEMFQQLRKYINGFTEQPDIALSAANVFADLIWRGSEEIQPMALEEEPGLLSLAGATSHWAKESLWSVRYQAVLHLNSLLAHPNPSIRVLAEKALVDRSVKESDKRVRGLLAKLKEDPETGKRLAALYKKRKIDLQRATKEEQTGLETQREELNNKERFLDQQRKDFEQQRGAWEKKIQEKQTELEERQKRLTGQEGELKRKKEEVEGLRTQLEKARKEYQEGKNSAKERFGQIKQQLTIRERGLELLEEEIGIEKAAVERERKGLNTSRRELQLKEVELQEERGQLQAQRRELREQEAALQEKIRNMEEMELPSQDKGSVERERQELATLRRELREQEAALQEKMRNMEETKPPSAPVSGVYGSEDFDWGQLKLTKTVNVGSQGSETYVIARLSNGRFVTATDTHFKLWDADWKFLKERSHKIKADYAQKVDTIISGPEGKFMIMGEQTSLWDNNGDLLESDLKRHRLERHSNNFPDFFWSLNERYNIRWNRYGAQIIDNQTMEVKPLSNTRDFTSLMRSVIPLPQGELLGMNSKGEVKIWRAPSLTPSQEEEAESSEEVKRPSFSSSEEEKGVQQEKSTFQSLQCVKTLPGVKYSAVESGMGGIAQLTNGHFVTSAGWPSVLQLWDSEWKLLKTVTTSYQLSPRKLMALSDGTFASYGSQSALWDKELNVVEKPNYYVSSDAFGFHITQLPNGCKMLSGRRRLCILDDRGDWLQKLDWGREFLHSVIVLKEGGLATMDGFGTVKIWKSPSFPAVSSSLTSV